MILADAAGSFTVSPETFRLLAPEIILVAAALVAYLAGAFAGFRHGWILAVAAIVTALVVAGRQPIDAVSSVVCIDGFASFVRWLVLVTGGLLVLVQSGDSRLGVRRPTGTCEEAGTFLLLLAGLSLVACASDLVLLFVALELVSIPTYVLLGLARQTARGQEATLKYFFLSLVASAFFLYAIVCLYGIGGSTKLVDVAAALQSPPGPGRAVATAMIPIAIGMAMAGAAFRLAAVPMHFYAPDVYEGTSSPMAALLSTLPKVAGVVVLARVLAIAGGSGTGTAAEWSGLFWQMTAVLAAVTMTVGNVMALLQSNLRRLLACSSIAHAGYMLVGIAVAAATDPGEIGGWIGLDGLSAVLFYLATYAFATVGVFAAITYLGHRWPVWTADTPRPPREEVSTVADLDGLSGTNPVAAFAVAVFLLSLAGIPPLPGFWGKLSLVTAALEVDWGLAIDFGGRRAWFLGLAVVLVLNAAIAAAYYLRLIAAMYFKSTDRGVQADGGLASGVAMLLCLAAVAMVTFQPGGLFEAAGRAGAAGNQIHAALPIAPGEQTRSLETASR